MCVIRHALPQDKVKKDIFVTSGEVAEAGGDRGMAAVAVASGAQMFSASTEGSNCFIDAVMKHLAARRESLPSGELRLGLHDVHGCMGAPGPSRGVRGGSALVLKLAVEKQEEAHQITRAWHGVAGVLEAVEYWELVESLEALLADEQMAAGVASISGGGGGTGGGSGCTAAGRGAC